MATYGYARVSTPEQAAGTSLEEQERRIRAVAMLRGVTLDDMFLEPGVSGSSPLERRPVGRVLGERLQSGDMLIVAKLDRAFRNAADALSKVEDWRQLGVRLIVADMGSEAVTDNGVAKMFFGMLALVAEFERDRLLERTNDGRRAKAARGGHVGGSAPFGYRVEGTGKAARLVPVPMQQQAIRSIRKLGRRLSLRQIAQAVEERHGLRVSHESIRRMLKAEPKDTPRSREG